ncbi:hypothetical protein NCCP133_38230 [Cytobacillus sp. NCCP-133]|nr:hypothetical protein NCCP133_38230 [Cytobacillus sp. NCCP-133]
MAATILSGLILTMTIVLEITVLGVNGLSNTVFPLLKMVEKINIGGFIKSLDGLAMAVLIIGDFFKVTVFAYAAVISAADLFKVKSHRMLVLPIGGMILYTSMVATDNFIEHAEQGKMVLRSVFPQFEFVIPLLLIIIASIRILFSSSNTD